MKTIHSLFNTLLMSKRPFELLDFTSCSVELRLLYATIDDAKRIETMLGKA